MKGFQRRVYRWNARRHLLGGTIMILTGLVVTSPMNAQQPTVAAHTQPDASADALLAQPVTIHLTNVSLKRAIDSVARVAQITVEYRLPLLRMYAKSVTLNATNTPLGIVFEQVLSGTALRVVPREQGTLTIVSVPGSQSDSVPSVGTVLGRVVDSATGRGLLGVTIKVTGTKLVIMTNDSGTFTLHDVPAGHRLLTVRVFGYHPAESELDVPDGQATTVRVRLVAVPNLLTGVVTTATGQQRKIEVGNDITLLNVDSIMQVAPITSVTDLLEARVPGVTVVHSSGTPGDPSRIRLRGPGSIYQNNDPIIIVDGIRVYGEQSNPRNTNQAASNRVLSEFDVNSGVPGAARPSPLDQIDPNEIEKIEVLKGPSASALYGSDAANGVLVITTKHGRAGPTTWDVQLGYGVNWIPGTWPTNYFRLKDESEEGRAVCNWFVYSCQTVGVVAFQALNDPRFTVLSHGTDQTAALTVSGGNGPITYSLTGSAAGDLGNLKLPNLQKEFYETSFGAIPGWMVRPDEYRTWGVNGSVAVHPTPKLQVSVLSSLFTSTQRRSTLEDAITQLEGAYVDSVSLAITPLVNNYVTRATSDQLTSTNSLTAAWTPQPWLPLTATGGINTIQTTDNAYIPYGIPSSGNAAGLSGNDTTGRYALGRGTSRNQSLSVGTGIPLFRQRMTLSLGGNVYSQATTDFNVGTNLLAPGVSVPSSFQWLDQETGTVINSPTSQSTSAASTYGWYVEPRINVNSKFFLSPGFRLDGGSGAAKSSGSVAGLSAFPKIDLSFVAVDRQSQPPLLGVLSLFRPRIAFGFAGTQPAPEDKLRLFNSPGLTQVVPLNDSTTLPVVALGVLGNTQLRPERSSELEGGFDADLWRGRLQLTYTQYNKVRHDALLQIPLAPSIGGISLSNFYYINPNNWINVGEIRNTGTEATVQAEVLQSRTLSWSVGINLSSDHNQVVRLESGLAPIVTDGRGSPEQTRVTPGYPLFSIWARPIASFADVNHDGIIEYNEVRLADSAVYVGQSNPNYQLTLTSDLTLVNGRLSVHGAFAYQNGLTQTNDAACNSGAFSLLPNAPNATLATQAVAVAANCKGIGGDAVSTIGLIQTVNVLRFQTLSINYTMPQRVALWFRVPRMTLALQGSNLGLHSNYRGKDPSVNAFSTVSAGDETADFGQIPEPRTWWLKVSLDK